MCPVWMLHVQDSYQNQIEYMCIYLNYTYIYIYIFMILIIYDIIWKGVT